jgi:comEA protein
MVLLHSDRTVLGALLGLAILGVGIDCLVNPLPQQSAVVIEEALDLNRASFAELLDLPGIGPTLAERILHYREEHGPFRTVEELLSVKGVGPQLLERLAGKIAVSSTESPP